MKCENIDCQKEHDGSYGSGRFCCRSCSYHKPKKKVYKSPKVSIIEVDKTSPRYRKLKRLGLLKK